MNQIQPAHSKIGASSYSRWSKTHGGCPGSVRLSENLPNVESEYAKEGTFAHDVAAKLLERYFFGVEPKDGWPHVEKEMLEAVKVYVEFIKQEALASGAKTIDNHILIEHRFDLASVHPGLFGTADAIIYSARDKKLIVADYKHGAGIAVDVEENLQLQYYGLGALLSTGFPCETVELVIVQPRCNSENGPIKRWGFSSIDLLDFAADLAFDAAETEKPDAELRPGKHCRFCPAAPVKCPAIKDKAQSLAKLEFKETLPYEPDKLAQALQFIPALEAWITKVREFAYGEAMHGRLPPGWKMVAKRATRKWKVSEEEVIDFMSKASGRDKSEFYNLSLKTPAQMEKLNNKHVNTQLREIIESVSSGYNLVPESDKRPAVALDPASEFTKIEGSK